MKKISALLLVLCMILSAFVLTACGEDKSSDDKTADSGSTSDTGSANKPAGDTDKPNNSGSANKPNESGSATKPADQPADKPKEESAYDIVAKALANTLSAKTCEATLKTSVKSDFRGNISENGLDVNVKASGLDTDKPAVLIEGKMIMEGYEAERVIFYDGEWKYSDGYKMKTPVSEFAKELGLAQNVIVALPESVFGNAQMSKNADGSTTVSITVDEAAFETLYRGAVVNVVYDVVGDMLDQATTKDAVITVTVANDYVKSYGITFVNEIVAGKDSISYTSAQTIEFVSCGEDMTVTAPAGFDAFYEVNWG